MNKIKPIYPIHLQTNFKWKVNKMVPFPRNIHEIKGKINGSLSSLSLSPLLHLQKKCRQIFSHLQDWDPEFNLHKEAQANSARYFRISWYIWCHVILILFETLFSHLGNIFQGKQSIRTCLHVIYGKQKGRNVSLSTGINHITTFVALLN